MLYFHRTFPKEENDYNLMAKCRHSKRGEKIVKTPRKKNKKV